MNNRDPLPQYEVASANKRFKVEDENDPCASVPDSVWNDPKTIVETKSDGHRFKFHVGAQENRLDSRRQSVNGGFYVEKTDHAPALRDLKLDDLSGTVFDGELVAGKDSNSVAHALGSHATAEEKADLHYVVFDIIMFRGVDVREKTDSVRRALLEKCFRETSLAGQSLVTLMPRPSSMTPQQKRQVLIDVLAAGGEGIMIKDTSKPYGKGWTKVKREARYDVFVIGYDEAEQFSVKKGDDQPTETKFFKMGWVGAIKFGQYVDGKITPFGQTSGMTEEVREEVSRDREGNIGRVFEIAAQERFPSGKFRHPRFIRWRDGEKLAVDCIYTEDEA